MKYTLLNLFLIAIFVYIAVTILKTFLIKYAASSNGFKNVLTLSCAIISLAACFGSINVSFIIKDTLSMLKNNSTLSEKKILVLQNQLPLLNKNLIIGIIIALVFLGLYIILMKNIKKERKKEINRPKRLWKTKKR